MTPEHSLAGILKGFETHHFRYLLIGGHAIAQYGFSRVTKDYDFWISPEAVEQVVDFLVQEENFEAPIEPVNKKPIMTLYSDWQKIDLFSARKLSNLEGKVLEFDECLKRATVFNDPAEKFAVVVPSLEDLIALKKMRKPSPRDLEDITFLESLSKKSQ